MRSRQIIDSHLHIFGLPGVPLDPHSPYVPYPPQRGTLGHFRLLMEAHGVERAVLVGARPYGTDNSCMLEALREFPAQFRGIALIDPERSTEAHWRELAGNGVVGFRIDLGDFDETVAASAGFQRLCGFSREVGWLLDAHCQAAQLATGANLLRATGLRVVIDHLGRPDVAAGLAGDAFAKVLEFGREGNALVKLSGAFRLSKAGPPYSDVDDYAGRVIEAFSIDNCLWGSDWPFVAIDQHVDYGPMLVGVQRWLPHQSDQDKVLWTNPMRVFGFAPGPGIAEAVA